MKKLCGEVATLCNSYFIEPDIFTFTQNNWELGNKLWEVKDNTEDTFNLLVSSGLSVSELSAFQKELLNIKNIIQEGDL